MRKRDLEKLKQLAVLLRKAASDIDTMVWYTEQGAETKGYQWLTAAIADTARSLIELKNHYSQVAKSDVGWILDDYGIKFKPVKMTAWSRIVELLR